MPHYAVRMRVNGKPVEMEVAPAASLLLALREAGFTEVKTSCEAGDCGACAVFLDGEAVNACLVFALQAEGAEVVTVRGVGTEGDLHPVQRAFLVHGAAQCGYCTPGMVVAAKALLDANPRPTPHEIRRGIAGNLCRCTGYQKIVEAIEAAAGELAR